MPPWRHTATPATVNLSVAPVAGSQAVLGIAAATVGFVAIFGIFFVTTKATPSAVASAPEGSWRAHTDLHTSAAGGGVRV